MMNFWHALILGLIQGVTEFFPVSSSAHLKITRLLLDIPPEEHALFDLSCHLGTLVALVYFLRTDIVRLFSVEREKIRLFIIALLPLVPFYFLLKPLREWASQTEFLGLFLMVTSLILFLANRLQWRVKSPTRVAFFVGTMQAAALIPGISRSASTISTARILGWSPSQAVRFSFMLSIPTILGGMGIESIRHVHTTFSWTPCAIGFIASLAVASLVLPFAFRLLEKGVLKPFAWYCLFAGIVVTLLYV